MVLRTFGFSFLVTLVSVAAAALYGGPQAVVLVLILGILEVSLSFDNAIVNATILEKMSDFWQKIFLTVGVLIAVFGMRLIFPLVIVWVTAGLDPVRAIDLALNPPADGAAAFADGTPSFETLLTAAHPQIAAFGGMFLLMLFLEFIFEEREITWLTWIERPLARIGRLEQLPVVVGGAVLVLSAQFLAPEEERAVVLIAGVLGMIVYICVNGLGELFEASHEDSEEGGSGGPSKLAKASGKAAFFLFLYLEVLDASFSFDGVIGAFAITSDPIIIALGLGFIGAMYVRSITIFLVRKGTLSEYRYLEHGAHWAIGALSIILFISIGVEVNDIVTGLIGVVLIGAAFISSIVKNRSEAAAAPAELGDSDEETLDEKPTPVG
jgi:hypothetical protein